MKAGIDLTHIPYRGTAGQVNDVLAGQIEIAPITVSAALPHVRAGKLVALAVASDKRTALMPEVPSLAEAKVPGVNGDVWYGLFGPKGLPPTVIDRLNAELKEILRTEEKAMALQGIEIQTNTPEEFRQLMATDSRRWAELIKVQGIKAD